MNLLRSLIAAAALCLSLPALAAQTACPPEASRATAFGLSTDTKPTFATNCATIYETDTTKLKSWNGSGWQHTPQDVTLGKPIAGERLIDSATNSYLVVKNELQWVVLDGTSAVTIGGGGANDTYLCEVFIMPNGGGAPTATITGFADQLGAAKSIVLTGSTTVDYHWAPAACMVNDAAALTVTPSVDDKVVVGYKARQ